MSTIFIPTNANSPVDLMMSFNLLQLFKEKNIATGLMLLIANGKKGLWGKAKNQQYKNFQEITNAKGKLPVIVMVSNLPLTELDFYHLPELSIEHIKLAIDFVTDLPGRIGNPAISFHLNTLIPETEWQKSGDTPEEKLEYWQQQFAEKVWPAIQTVSNYAKQKKIELKIETTPTPEFGDKLSVNLNTLGNPYPLYSGRGFKEVRTTGAGIALDLCHTFTLYKAASRIHAQGKELFKIYKGLFPADLKKIVNKNLMQEIEALKKNDIVHLNDSRNLFDPNNNTLHEEGVPLGEGEIKNLPDIIKKILNKNLRLVFEVHEDNYNQRKNLQKSINYFLKHVYKNS